MGVGHTAAANAVREALEQHYPGTQSRVVNSYKYAAFVVSSVVSNGYLGMVKTIPQMYRYLYTRAERATQVGPFRAWVHQFTANNLRELMLRERPDVVVCTHAFPCGVMAEYRRQFDDAPPVAGVVTDFAVHAYWANDETAAYAVATPSMRSALSARGVRAERIHITGIPVRAAFGVVPQDPRDVRERLGLPPDGNVVLLMGGGLGIGPLSAMLKALDALDQPVCAVAIVGRSARAEQRVIDCAAGVGYPVRVVRFVENVYDYMHAADVLISKPGGLTSAEALAARLPMVLFKPLPGQEERNTQHLVRHGAAVRARDASDLARVMRTLLSDRVKRDRMRESMATLAKPDAAQRIAHIVADLAKKGVLSS